MKKIKLYKKDKVLVKVLQSAGNATFCDIFAKILRNISRILRFPSNVPPSYSRSLLITAISAADIIPHPMQFHKTTLRNMVCSS